MIVLFLLTCVLQCNQDKKQMIWGGGEKLPFKHVSVR